MPIIDNELVGEGVIDNEGQFHPSRYVPSITGENIVQKIQENVALHGNLTWMTDLSTGKSMTYSQLAVAIDRLHISLRRRGLRPRDTVGLVGSNHIEIPIVFFAVWKACGSCSGLDIGLFPEQIRNRLIETKCRFIMTDEPRAEKVLQAVQGLDIQVFVFGQAEGCIPIAQLFEPQEKFEHDEFEFDVLAPAWFTYSSGTTGIPKGIVHTHYSLSPYLRPPDDRNEQSELVGQKLMFTGSMVHGSGLFNFTRGTVEHKVIFTFSDPKLEAILHGINLIKPTVISIFPYELAGMCIHPELEKYDLSSVETLIYCGCSILSTFERRIFEIMSNLHNLISMYGMSETMLLTLDKPKPKPAIKMDREEIIKNHKIGSSGQVLPFAKLKIIDSNTGEKLGPGGVGEVVANTPFLMRGYLNQPTEVTDGWFSTGDQGYYDADGDLFVIGRYKEMIKYKAKKVAPSKIETQMMTHPAVKDVAVIGLPHDIDGEHPLAYVVIKTNQEGRPLANPQELIDFTNERVADKEKLRGGVRFIESIPRNKLGKILRHHLVAKLQSELNGAI
ncbi:4-coumarate--CoA ligase-like 7 [Daphnia pulicaria]|uniref:4-coumarate--CoA ligase-like 7 n=1 Tax=Daphnia pulicaria TaxID=35523 RepID=UPI001EEB2DB1|nr:4-coumarate--CoA ligase-like 7 [Daphnia pulicaria]